MKFKDICAEVECDGRLVDTDEKKVLDVDGNG